jgi:NTE family protein
VDSTAVPTLSAKRLLPPDPTKITVDFVRVVNKSRLADSLITSRLRLKVGDKLDIDELEKDIANIYGLDYFETVSYQVAKEEGKTGVVITAVEKTAGLNSLRFGLNLENDFDGDSAYNIKVRYQSEGLNDLGGELVVEAEVGERLGFAASFLQPLDPGTRYFIVPRFEYLARDVPIFINGHEVAELRVSSVTGGLSIGRQLANWGVISAGMDIGYGWTDVNTGDVSLSESDFDIGELFGRFSYDTLDNIYFPNDGARANVEFRRSDDAWGGESDFNKITTRATIANTWDRDTFIVVFKSGITTAGTAEVQDLFELGGLFNLSGFRTDELTGQNLTLGELIYYRKIGVSPAPFKIPIYLGASLETGNVWDDRSDMSFNDVIFAGSVFLGLDTFLGPVYVAYGHAEGGHKSVYLFLGQTF